MKEITLNRKQISTLTEIAEHFPEIDLFTIVSDSSNGIGPVVTVKFTLVGRPASIDCTDVESW